MPVGTDLFSPEKTTRKSDAADVGRGATCRFRWWSDSRLVLFAGRNGAVFRREIPRRASSPGRTFYPAGLSQQMVQREKMDARDPGVFRALFCFPDHRELRGPFLH